MLKVAKEVERRVLARARSRVQAGQVLQHGVVSPRQPSGKQPTRPPNESENVVAEQITTTHEQQQTKSESKSGKEKDILKEWKRSWRVGNGYRTQCLLADEMS